MAESQKNAEAFSREVTRLKHSGVLGESGRLLELFEFFAGRGLDAEPASQAEIAETVFGSVPADGDDATVRVYVHRLRKRLEDFYTGNDGSDSFCRLTLPAGTYALRIAAVREHAAASDRSIPWRRYLWPLVIGAVCAAFVLGWLLRPGAGLQNPNQIWEPILESDRPITVVVGDYYIYGEIDPVRPEEGRLIRDFTINSPSDLALAQETNPERYAQSEDFGLNYLPFSSAYALKELMPVLAGSGKSVRILAASQVDSDTLRNSDIIYLGLISGLGLLEENVFAGSGFAIGESYDELTDIETGRTYVSEEARRLASPSFYRDYGYLASFKAPGGSLIAVVAGSRDTGLRALAPIAAAPELPDALSPIVDGAGAGGFEALFEITGQQGADLNDRLAIARPRPGSD